MMCMLSDMSILCICIADILSRNEKNDVILIYFDGKKIKVSII